MSEAKKRGFVASDARVDVGLHLDRRKHEADARTALNKALQSRGVSPDTLKRRLKVQISWQQLVQARTRFQVAVKPSDITAQLFAKGSPDDMSMTEFILQQIIFVTPKGSSAGVHRATAARGGGLPHPLPGLRQERRAGQGPQGRPRRDPLGGDMSNELTGPEGKMVQDTPVGKTTQPSQVDQGITLVAVCSKRDIKSNAAARTEIEQKLTFEQTKDLGKDYLKELRGKAVIEYR